MARSRSCASLWLVLLAAGFMAMFAAAQEPNPSPIPSPTQFPDGNTVTLPVPFFDLIPPLVRDDPAVKHCLVSLQRVPGCVGDILGSFFTGQIHVGGDCCAAYRGLGHSCVRAIFPFVLANPWFEVLVRGFCGSAPHSPPETKTPAHA